MGKNKNKNKNKNNYNSTSLAVSNTANETKSTDDDVKEKETTTTKTTKFSSYYKNKNRKNYDYKGTKNKTKYPFFVDLCKFSQDELKLLLPKYLLDYGYEDVVIGDGYIYAKGELPVLLTAHMDTVHKELIKDFYEYYDEEKKQHIITSPQGIGGDDRCGIYMILKILKTHKCSVLFCEDEEIGGKGSEKFCKTELINELSELNYLIELDRANGTDAVFYDCDNYDFVDFIEDNTGYKEAYGSFSDISNLSPECKVASVNLSCGYYNAHTTSEYVIVEEMLNTIETVKKLIDVESKQYEYFERPKPHYGYRYGGCYGGYYSDYYSNYYGKNKDKYYDYYDDYDYDDDDYYYGSYYASKNKTHKSNETSKTSETYSTSKTSYTAPEVDEERSLFIFIYNDVTGNMETYVSNGANEDEAFGKFFRNNPLYCFEDIYDYDFYEQKLRDDGWYLEY